MPYFVLFHVILFHYSTIYFPTPFIPSLSSPLLVLSSPLFHSFALFICLLFSFMPFHFIFYSSSYQDVTLVQYELVTAPGWIMFLLFSVTLVAVIAVFTDPIIVKQKSSMRLGVSEKKNKNEKTFLSSFFSILPFFSSSYYNRQNLSTGSSSSSDNTQGVSTMGGMYGAIPVQEQVICIELGDLLDKSDGHVSSSGKVNADGDIHDYDDEEYGYDPLDVDISNKKKKSYTSTSSTKSKSIISPLRSSFSQNINTNTNGNGNITMNGNGNINTNTSFDVGNAKDKSRNSSNNNLNKIWNNNDNGYGYGNGSEKSNNSVGKEKDYECEKDIYSDNNDDNNNNKNNKNNNYYNNKMIENVIPESMKIILQNLNSNSDSPNSKNNKNIGISADVAIPKKNMLTTANLYLTSSPAPYNVRVKKEISRKENDNNNNNDNNNKNSSNNNGNNGYYGSKDQYEEMNNNNSSNYDNDNNNNNNNNSSNNFYNTSNNQSIISFSTNNSANSSGKMSSGKMSGSIATSKNSSRRGSTETIESGRDTLSSLDVRTLSKMNNNNNSNNSNSSNYNSINNNMNSIDNNKLGIANNRKHSIDRINDEDRTLYDASSSMSSSGRFILAGSDGTYTYNYKKRDIEDDNDGCWLCCNLFGVEVAVILFIYLINKTGQEMIVSSIPCLSSEIFGWDSQRAGFFMATMGVIYLFIYLLDQFYKCC